jgi:hypothetical protein
MKATRVLWLLVLGLSCATACGDDDDDRGSAAQRMGVGASCTSDQDCPPELMLECLSFKGGYCGLEGCASDVDCPPGSACVEHADDGNNYCFLICADKPECNWTRPVDAESNCSSSVVFTDGHKAYKACVPPS